MKYLMYRGAMYRLAAQPKMLPPGKTTEHPTGGPRMSREQFALLGQLSKPDFEQIADVLVSKMVQLCTQQYVNAENWCIAINGETMGVFHDQDTARKVAKHWLFLKSLRPDADIKVGKARTRPR